MPGLRRWDRYDHEQRACDGKLTNQRVSSRGSPGTVVAPVQMINLGEGTPEFEA